MRSMTLLLALSTSLASVTLVATAPTAEADCAVNPENAPCSGTCVVTLHPCLGGACAINFASCHEGVCDVNAHMGGWDPAAGGRQGGR